MARLSEAQRLKIVELKGQGFGDTFIAREVQCSPRHVANVWVKYQKHQTIKDLLKSGRPRKLDERDDRILRRGVRKDQYQSAVEARRNLMPHVSVWTVR